MYLYSLVKYHILESKHYAVIIISGENKTKTEIEKKLPDKHNGHTTTDFLAMSESSYLSLQVNLLVLALHKCCRFLQST